MRRSHHRHPSDLDLIMLADGEMFPRRADEIRTHLASCWSCRVRMKELEDTIADFVRAQRSTQSLPSAEGPRALLRARLAELAGNPPQSQRHRGFAWMSLAAAIVVMVAIAVALREPTPHTRSASESRLRPDPRLTPGSVVLSSAGDLCAAGKVNQAGVIPVAFGERVFQAYGIRSPKPRAYELDYLIPPELGGSSDIRNFWPQPYSPEWNARLKDALEDRLHDLVCAGEIRLATAQHEIATDWIAAYTKYFQTDIPHAAHYAFAKDRPWE